MEDTNNIFQKTTLSSKLKKWVASAGAVFLFFFFMSAACRLLLLVKSITNGSDNMQDSVL